MKNEREQNKDRTYTYTSNIPNSNHILKTSAKSFKNEAKASNKRKRTQTLTQMFIFTSTSLQHALISRGRAVNMRTNPLKKKKLNRSSQQQCWNVCKAHK
jgi:hypothetical protein